MIRRLLFLSLLATLSACGDRHINPLDPGRLTFTPERVDFGELDTNQQADERFTVHNPSKVAIVIRASRLEGASAERFTAELGLPLTLEGGASKALPVRFSSGPKTAHHEAQLVLEVDGAEEETYALPLEGDAKEGFRPRWIVFDSNRSGGNVDLYAVRADGTELKRLTTEEWTEVEPAFSPDGRQLAFVSDRDDFTMQIFVMELATKTVRQVTHGALSARQPAWSPDGTRLVFHRDIGVYTIAVDGTDEVHVIDGLNALNAYQHPSYLPGGKWIVMDRGNEIDVIRPDGTDFRQVVQNDTTTIVAPSASPSGATVAFAAFCGGGFSVRSTLTSALGSACHDASEVQFPGRRPAWGPEQIAFETDEANSEIMVVAATGGTALNVSQDAANDRNPAWAPADAVIP